MPQPRGVAGLLAGFGLPFEGLGLLRRERRLWGPAAVPFLLSLLAVAGALMGIVSQEAALRGAIASVLPWPEAGAWYSWLWVGPARTASWLAAGLLFLAAAALALVAAFLLASLVAAPFHELLSRRVETVTTGGVVEAEASGLRAVLGDALRALADEARRLALFAAVLAVVLALGLVPGGALVAPVLLTAFTVTFLPLEYAGYSLDRRRLSFGQKRGWLAHHRAVTLGYGGAAFLLCAVPGLNLLAMPVLVVSGTLLALRHPPDPPQERAG